MKFRKLLRDHFFLIAIVVIAAYIRFIGVSSVPPSLSWDEVSIGYNAYSILKTGKDEHGRFLPIDTFVGYGDYKPPLAVYLTVPFIAVFGLTELAVRLPSVIAGTLAVLLTYLLVLELFRQEAPSIKHQIPSKHQAPKFWNLEFENWNLQAIALLSAFLLAVSPWHIQLSRAGWEANIALTILLFGIWLVLLSRERPRVLMVCWMPFVLAMYTFNSARYVAPFLALLFFFWIRDKIWAYKRYALVGIFLGLILLAPLMPHLVSPEARLRFTEVNIFSDLSIIEKSNDRMAVDGNTFFARIFHNRRVGFGIEYLKHLFDHLQPWFLFIRGDGNPKFSLQDVGQLYLIEAPFLVYGIYRLFAVDTKLAWTLILWIVLAILPAGVARETPHALRIENTLPVWHIFTAYGLIALVKSQKSPPEADQPLAEKVKSNLVFIVYCLLFIASFSYFWHNYFNHYAQEYSAEWQYGYKQAIAQMQQFEDSYDGVVLSEAYGRSYMYTLFFTRTDPSAYLASKKSTFDAAGFYHVFGFGKYRFTDKGIGSFDRGILYVALSSEAPGGERILSTIKRLNGETAFVLFDKP
ncbi:MAG: glycosyltransferase family 39 protein [Patescibacteria group bacterium]